jgi:3-oxoadipate enol-lactonase
VPDRGEFFVRDSGGSGQPVLLVHGWMFPSDLNWLHVYAPLQRAGYRVLAMDLRGHGRGLRTGAPFRLQDCADDAAGVLTRSACHRRWWSATRWAPGDAAARQAAPFRRRRVRPLRHRSGLERPAQKAFWRTMAVLRLVLGLFPQSAWRGGMRLAGAPARESNWVGLRALARLGRRPRRGGTRAGALRQQQLGRDPDRSRARWSS